MTRAFNRFSAAIVALLLLGGITAETLSRPRPADAEPFHARIKKLGESVPMDIGDWKGMDVPPTPAAVALLRPNLMIHRTYKNQRTGLVANLLIVQCRTARDMAGHYPPICYPAHGWTAVSTTPTAWQVGGRTLAGVEYEFNREMEGRSASCVVCNLLILPDGRFVREMNEIYRAAGSYLRQFYGSAQVQVVMSAEYPEQQRREIVDTLLTPNLPLLEAMATGETR